jgi:hypothetical protein
MELNKKRKFTSKNNNKHTIFLIILLSSVALLTGLSSSISSSSSGSSNNKHIFINALSQNKGNLPSPSSLPISHHIITKESRSKNTQLLDKVSTNGESQTQPSNYNAINAAAGYDVSSIAHHLEITSINASKTQASLGTPCLPNLDKFILPPKESRFTIIKPCVTVTGKVVWTHYFNEDGDANFNIVLDPPYKDMLGPGSYSQVFANKYPGGPALHIETVCQGPVTSLSPENVGACNGYKGPNFKNVLPKIGDHVMVTGRYLVEMPEMPGGITELHPAYDIRILHP